MEITISTPVSGDSKFELGDNKLKITPTFYKGEPKTVLAVLTYDLGGKQQTYLLQLGAKSGELSLANRSKAIIPTFLMPKKG